MTDSSAKQPIHRASFYWIMLIQNGVRELKFLRSWKDLINLYDKVSYVVPQKLGIYERTDAIPPSMQLEPINYCNARCICCSTQRSKRIKGLMDFELFKKIIDDAALSGMKRIHLYLHGEPMLHPRIIDMIGYIKLKDLAMHLTTNGVPFSTEKIIAILNSGVSSADHFIFSMLGNSKDVHEKIMKRVSHQKVLNNINEFLALREKYHVNGPVIETMFYPMPENQHEIEMYRKNWQRIVDHARTATSISYSFSDYKREAKTIVHRQKTCRLLWERLTVFWNGDVTICAHDVDGDWIIGNLAEKSIKEISKSEQLLYVKKTHLQKQFTQFPFCSECDM